MKEIWKDIKGYEGCYQVSNTGKVKSLSRIISRGHKIKEKILKGGISGHGYLSVGLSIDGKLENKRVHRLVCEHFIDNPENKPQVNHIDGCKTNNNLSNLEWSTYSENNQHAFDTGLNISANGSKQWLSKLTEKDIPKIFQLRAEGMIVREIAAIFGVSRSAISNVIHGRTWGHIEKGYKCVRAERITRLTKTTEG